MILLDGYRGLLAHRVSSAEADLARFKSALDKNPAEAMEWSLQAFEAAAALSVNRAVLAQIGKGATADKLLDRALMATLHGARGGSSTSPASNLMKLCMTAEWARIVRDLRGEP